MGIEKIKEDLLFFAVVIPIFLALIFMTYFSLNRESKHNRRVLEYEAESLAADLLELAGRGESPDLQSLGADILGFGIYPGSGKASFRIGTAPEILPPRERNWRHPEFTLTGGRLVLIRVIGFPPPPSGGMPPMIHRPRGGEAFPMERGFWPPRSPARQLYLEIDVDLWQRRQAPLRVGLYIVPAALVAALLSVSRLYRKNRGYRKREERNRRLVGLGEAARTLTHEIKNPLGAIKIQTATLRKTAPEEYRKNLDIIEEETGRLNHLVDRVGEFLRNPRGEPQSVDIVPFVEDMLKRFAFPIAFHPAEGPVRVFFDPQLLRTVLENLLLNAGESMEEKTGLPEAERGVEVELKLVRGTVFIRIRDRGSGLPERIGEEIFDPFYTNKTRGSGIGLAVSRRFVEAAGGELRLVSREGGGTEAELRLPEGPPS